MHVPAHSHRPTPPPPLPPPLAPSAGARQELTAFVEQSALRAAGYVQASHQSQGWSDEGGGE